MTFMSAVWTSVGSSFHHLYRDVRPQGLHSEGAGNGQEEEEFKGVGFDHGFLFYHIDYHLCFTGAGFLPFYNT